MAQKVSREGLIEIASHEGIVTSPYKDSVGIWTFGIGHTSGAGAPSPAMMQKGVAQPIAVIMEVFANDVPKYETRVNEALLQRVKQCVFDGATSFDFNTGGIHRASWLRYFRAGKIADAKKSIMDWRKPPEIIPRREKERDLIFSGRYTSGGFANVYPADARGRVLWGKGKRVNVASLMDLPNVPGIEPGIDDAMADGILERGERGAAVEQLITDLIDLGLYERSTADEPDKIFGPRTQAAVKALQVKCGLVVDGRAGPKTFAAVTKLLDVSGDTASLTDGSTSSSPQPTEPQTNPIAQPDTHWFSGVATIITKAFQAWIKRRKSE